MYSVAFFEDSNEVEVTPSSWIGESGDTCRFPSNIKGSSLHKAIEKCMEVNLDWPQYKNVTVFAQTDDYQKARRKCKRVAENENINKSDLETTDVDNNPRKRIASTKYSDMDGEGEDDASSAVAKKKKKHAQYPSLTSMQSQKTIVRPCPELPALSESVSTPFHKETNLPSHPESQSVIPSQRFCYEDCIDSARSPDVLQETPTRSPGRSEFENIMGILMEVKAHVRNNNQLLKKIWSRQTANMEAGDPDVISEFPLPMCKFEDVTKVEGLLDDRQKAKNLVAFLTTLGGFSDRQVVEKILRAIISNKLAVNFNWSGKGSKQGFGLLKVAAVVKEACKQGNVKEANTEEIIKLWLKNATDRDGGRRARQRRKNGIVSTI